MQIDEVSIPYLIFFRHRGVLVRYWNGSSRVYACSPNGGVVRQSLEEFADGHTVTAVAAKTRLTPEQVVARAESVLGQPYDAVKRNCDHFVAFALDKKIESPQLQIVTLGLIALAVGALARS